MGEYFKGNFGIFTEWVLTPGNFAQLAPNAPRAGFIFALFVIYKSCCLPLKNICRAICLIETFLFSLK